MTRCTAGASWGASAGLPRSTVWSTTTPWSLSRTWAFVAELDRPPEPTLGDRAGVRVVQADPAGGAVWSGPGQPLAGLFGDPAGGGEQPLDYKRTKELDQIRQRPHPWEFMLYYDL